MTNADKRLVHRTISDSRIMFDLILILKAFIRIPCLIDELSSRNNGNSIIPDTSWTEQNEILSNRCDNDLDRFFFSPWRVYSITTNEQFSGVTRRSWMMIEQTGEKEKNHFNITDSFIMTDLQVSSTPSTWEHSRFYTRYQLTKTMNSFFCLFLFVLCPRVWTVWSYIY